jgi:class 3 adenylate cyclase
VRDRLYAVQEAKEQARAKPATWEASTKKDGKLNSIDGIGSTEYSNKEVIASLYPETTIFFADIAGFTKWSSTRSPTKVFQLLLLETLYGAFDAIAMRRNVFKVETIGDCYVAVAGVPEPQEGKKLPQLLFCCLLLPDTKCSWLSCDFQITPR